VTQLDAVGRLRERKQMSALLLIAGGARAASLAIRARDGGWPVLHRQVLVLPLFTDEQPMPSNVARVAPATVLSAGDASDDGVLYAARLRAAGVEVDQPRAFAAIGRSLR
jgi:acetyl esterase/lipase